MTTILDGKKVASKIKEQVKNEVFKLNQENIPLTISVIQVGDDPASKIYLRAKGKMAKEVGINEKFLKFSNDITQEQLLDTIKKLNEDNSINGIMVQLPLPEQIDERIISESINPNKDIDGFHPFNQGKLWQGKSDIIPATVRGILTLLDYYKINVSGKNALVIGQSMIVGKPIASQLLQRDATISIAHSKTKNLKEFTKRADIIVSDVGKAHLISADMIKPESILIDVGMNRENGKLMGDIEYNQCLDKAKAITPVPGGVGPLTVVSLMEQVVILARKQNGR